MPAACQSCGVTEPKREKAHLELDKPPSEKPDLSGFSGNRILHEAKCAVEKPSQKVPIGLFDKLPRFPEKTRRRRGVIDTRGSFAV